MSMDPAKWIHFQKLSLEAQTRLQTAYPYLRLEEGQFQEKDSGVFFRQSRGRKTEKLLDPPGYEPKLPSRPQISKPNGRAPTRTAIAVRRQTL